MTAGFIAPGSWVEIASQLRKSGSVTLTSKNASLDIFDQTGTPIFDQAGVALLDQAGSYPGGAVGTGTITFDTDHANQRWVVTGVVVNTNQPATATLVPYATGALNTTDISQMSSGNQLWTSWDGNNDSIGPPGFDVGPCDFFSVLFYPPPGQDGTLLGGVIATAVVTGTKYTRRG